MGIYLIFTCVLYNFCAKVAAFDGSQVLLVTLSVAVILVEHVWGAGFRLRFKDGVPHLLCLDLSSVSALRLVPG